VSAWTFTAKANWYADTDCLGQSYVLTSDNSDVDIYLQIGRKYQAIIYEARQDIGVDIARVKRLLEQLKGMQNVGIDGKQFLVVGGNRDLDEIKEEINHALEFINVFDNDSNRRNQQGPGDGEAEGN
jgi:hypothetical protein